MQKQIKKEMCMIGSAKGDPLGQTQFHIPLFAAVWSVARESSVVPGRFARCFKEALGAAVSRGNLCRFCCYWHSNTAAETGMGGMREAWRHGSLAQMHDFHKRHKAILLWFRDATHPGFFEPRVRPRCSHELTCASARRGVRAQLVTAAAARCRRWRRSRRRRRRSCWACRSSTTCSTA